MQNENETPKNNNNDNNKPSETKAPSVPFEYQIPDSLWKKQLIYFENQIVEKITYNENILSAKLAYKTLQLFFRNFPANKSYTALEIFEHLGIDLANLIFFNNNFISNISKVIPNSITDVNIEKLRPLLIRMLEYDDDLSAKRQALRGAQFTHQDCIQVFGKVLGNMPEKLSREDMKLVASYVPDYMLSILNQKELTDKFTLDDLVALRFLYPKLRGHIGNIIKNRMLEQPELMNTVLANPALIALLSAGQWRFIISISENKSLIINNKFITTQLKSIDEVDVEELRPLFSSILKYNGHQKEAQGVTTGDNFKTAQCKGFVLYTLEDNALSQQLSITDLRSIVCYVPEAMSILLTSSHLTKQLTLDDLTWIHFLYPDLQSQLGNILKDKIIENPELITTVMSNPDLIALLSIGHWRFIMLTIEKAKELIVSNSISTQLNSIHDVPKETLRSACLELLKLDENNFSSYQRISKGGDFEIADFLKFILNFLSHSDHYKLFTKNTILLTAAYIPEAMRNLLFSPVLSDHFSLDDLIILKQFYPKLQGQIGHVVKERIVKEPKLLIDILANPDLTSLLSAEHWRFLAFTDENARALIVKNNAISIHLENIHAVNIEELRPLCAQMFKYAGKAYDKDYNSVVSGANFTPKQCLTFVITILEQLSTVLSNEDMKLIACYVPEVMQSVLSHNDLADKFTLDDLIALKFLYPHLQYQISNALKEKVIKNPNIITDILANSELTALLPVGQWRHLALSSVKVRELIIQHAISIKLESIVNMSKEELRPLFAQMLSYSGDTNNHTLAMKGANFTIEQCLMIISIVLNKFSSKLTSNDLKLIASYAPEAMLQHIFTTPQLMAKFSSDDLIGLQCLYPTWQNENNSMHSNPNTMFAKNDNNDSSSSPKPAPVASSQVYSSMWSTPKQKDDDSASIDKIIKKLQATKLSFETIEPYISDNIKSLPTILLALEAREVNSQLLTDIALSDQKAGEEILKDPSLAIRLEMEDLLKIGSSKVAFAKLIKQDKDKILMTSLKEWDKQAAVTIVKKAQEKEEAPIPTPTTNFN